MKRLLKLIVSIAYFIVRYIVSRQYSTCVVLCYHGVLDEDRFRFAKQMEVLKRWAFPIPINEPELYRKNTTYVAVTFDDGLVSVVHNAVPELTKHQIPATIFVPTGYLGKKCTWMRSAKEYMQDVGKPVPHKDLVQLKNDRVMNSEELRLLDKSLFVIGSHGVTHHNMDLMSDETMKKELTESKSILESVMSNSVTLLSFPRGKFNEKLLEFCKDAGYSRTFSISPTKAFGDSNEYVTGRVVVEPTDWEIEFWLKFKGAYCWLPAVGFLKGWCRRYL